MADEAPRVADRLVAGDAVVRLRASPGAREVVARLGLLMAPHAERLLVADGARFPLDLHLQAVTSLAEELGVAQGLLDLMAAVAISARMA